MNPDTIHVIDTELLSVVCEYRGEPAPTVSMTGQGITEGFLIVTPVSPVRDNTDCSMVTRSLLSWGTSDYEERRSVTGPILCTAGNGIGENPPNQTFNINVQCKLYLNYWTNFSFYLDPGHYG